MQQPNPFTPIFGQVPLHLAGREKLVSLARDAFERQPNSPFHCTLLVGARGTGKTTLLNLISQEAISCGWVAVSVSALPGMLEEVLLRANAAANQLIEQPGRKLTGLQFGQILGLEWQNPAPVHNWRMQMEEVLDQLAEHDAGLLICVDEVDASLDELKTLVSAFQLMIGAGRRVSLMLAGLPYNVNGLVNGKSTSFLRRAHRENLGRIDDAMMARAFRQTLADQGRDIHEPALDLALQAIQGFPYMMQLVGYWSWQAAGEDEVIGLASVQEGILHARDDMSASVLEATYNSLSEADIAFLEAMLPDAGESRMADILARLGVSNAYGSQYRLRLLAQGVIGERGRGKLGFDLPFFREYVAAHAQTEALPAVYPRSPVPTQAWREAQAQIASAFDCQEGSR